MSQDLWCNCNTAERSKMEYIVAYNTFSGLAWLLILLTSLKNISNWEFSYNSTFQIALITIVQTAAVAEVSLRLISLGIWIFS